MKVQEVEIIYDDAAEVFTVIDDQGVASEDIFSVIDVADILNNVYGITVTDETIKNITLLKIGQEAN